jgi:hypothetical protein
MGRAFRRPLLVIVAVAAAIAGFAGPASADGSYTNLTVQAVDAAGDSTGIYITAGQVLSFSEVSTTATYGYEGTAGCVGYPLTHISGARYVNGIACSPLVKDDPNATFSGGPIGGLIVRIGSGPWLAACSGTAKATTSGTLVLGYNDSLYGDNQGQYVVNLTVTTPTPTPPPPGGGGCISPCKY